MNFHITVERLQLLEQLLVLEKKFLCLFRLILKLCGQLVVLEDCESGFAVKLLLPEGEEV